MSEAFQGHRLERLNERLAPDPARFKRVVLLQAPGLTVLHLSLMPGQAVPEHTHPSQHVLLQGLVGETTVYLDGERLSLEPQVLLAFEGEPVVSLVNESAGPSAVLITLVKRQAA